jgi:hypothetical protein
MKPVQGRRMKAIEGPSTIRSIPPATPTILNLFQGARPMTRRNSRRFHFEFLEGRNAPSHFGAHALVAHAVVHNASATHSTVATLDRHDASPNDSSNDSANDSSRDSTNDISKDPSNDRSSRS